MTLVLDYEKETTKRLLPGEEFKPIEGFENYEISNYGNVYCLNTGKLKPRADNIKGKHTYPMVSLNSRAIAVHRLAARAFVPNPNNYTVVNRLDFNKRNPHYLNLEWTTMQGNIDYSKEKGRLPTKRRTKAEIKADRTLLLQTKEGHRKIKLTNHAIRLLQSSKTIRKSIQNHVGLTEDTISRWLRTNSINLTMAGVLAIIIEETGMSKSDLLGTF